MKQCEFQCGGGRGAWECLVDVSLTDKEYSVLKEYKKDHEHLSMEQPVEEIYFKVMKALEEQCDEDADFSGIVIWPPFMMGE